MSNIQLSPRSTIGATLLSNDHIFWVTGILILTITAVATVQKIVTEILPPSSGLAFGKDARDLLIECCVEFITLISSEANEISEKESKKTIACEHITKALEQLGFGDYVQDITEVANEHKEQLKVCAYFCHLKSHQLTIVLGTGEESQQARTKWAVNRATSCDAGRGFPGRGSTTRMNLWGFGCIGVWVGELMDGVMFWYAGGSYTQRRILARMHHRNVSIAAASLCPFWFIVNFVGNHGKYIIWWVSSFLPAVLKISVANNIVARYSQHHRPHRRENERSRVAFDSGRRTLNVYRWLVTNSLCHTTLISILLGDLKAQSEGPRLRSLLGYAAF